MLIYISLPITGHDIGHCKWRALDAKRALERRGHTALTPFDVCADGEGHPYPYYMGKDIEALLGCDAILRLPGWTASKGCMLESRCAQIYGKHIYDAIEVVPDITAHAPEP